MIGSGFNWPRVDAGWIAMKFVLTPLIQEQLTSLGNMAVDSAVDATSLRGLMVQAVNAKLTSWNLPTAVANNPKLSASIAANNLVFTTLRTLATALP